MTARLAWVWLLGLAAVLLEIWLARLGLLVAVWPLLTLYVGITLGAAWGLGLGSLACVVSEILLGRSGTALPLLLGLLPLVNFWQQHGDRRYLLVQMLPAGAAGAVYAAWHMLLANWQGFWPVMDWRQGGILTAAGGAAASFLGPVMWRLLDGAAWLLGLPRYYQSQGVRDPAHTEPGP